MVRKLIDRAGLTVSLRFDAGRWSIERREGKHTPKAVEIEPEALDALVKAWPEIRR